MTTTLMDHVDPLAVTREWLEAHEYALGSPSLYELNQWIEVHFPGYVPDLIANVLIASGLLHHLEPYASTVYARASQ